MSNSNSTPSGSRVVVIDQSTDRFPFCVVWSPIP
ncbi:hypothetical protein L917_08099 [Phytophthora nicotianae]|nr:hypothetical protein L917_08099 [Phytophthora nicotianae]ETM47069.1 hypothetical protein L914_08164 [Phytophthora nicotianae]ETO76042.1 hypothetical protein F444_08501 [Phytophthora nicotianae P1976]